jgi:hypothetical protein
MEDRRCSKSKSSRSQYEDDGGEEEEAREGYSESRKESQDSNFWQITRMIEGFEEHRR